jgi:hypothetical protein
MNYVDEIASQLGQKLPDCPIDLLRLYALLVLVKGVNTSLEDVHDAWAAWRCVTRPDHPSLVPFYQLKPEVQELDGKYRDAIMAVSVDRHT